MRYVPHCPTDKQEDMSGAKAHRAKAYIAMTVAAMLLASVIACLATLICMEYSANNILPEDTTYTEYEGLYLTDIDWEYWDEVNPDIIGWITVPDTNIDYPIVQAHKENPTYYLDHDIYGNYNYCGVPYLDYRCEKDGFDSLNATIFGHHLNNNTMFSAFSNFDDRGYALAHHIIVLQTPERIRILYVNYVDVVDANVYKNQLSFADRQAYTTWYENCLTQAKTTLRTTLPERDCMFVTCSYTHGPNERTIVVASEN